MPKCLFMPVDLAELAADCRTEAEPRACEVRVEGHIADAVVCDQGLIRRALENALRNAIRFSPQGRGDDVKLRESHSSVMVTVQDYGPGRRKALCSASSTLLSRRRGARLRSRWGRTRSVHCQAGGCPARRKDHGAECEPRPAGRSRASALTLKSLKAVDCLGLVEHPLTLCTGPEGTIWSRQTAAF
jgi:hypothetical protein